MKCMNFALMYNFKRWDEKKKYIYKLSKLLSNIYSITHFYIPRNPHPGDLGTCIFYIHIHTVIGI